MNGLRRRQGVKARSLGRYQRTGMAILLVCVGCAIIGCTDRKQLARDLRRQQQEAAMAEIKQDHIADAFSYLRQYVDLDEEAAAERIAFHLNAWNESTHPQVDWKPAEPLLKLLPKRAGHHIQGLADRRFGRSDLDHLRTCYVLSRVADWATQGESLDPLFNDWLQQQTQTLEAASGRTLARACRLFDWTVRNIRLQAMRLPEDGPSPREVPEGLIYQGPGYRQTVYETLLHGEGDAYVRGRVFVQLCRQLEIDACMLGIVQNNTMVTWLTAVRVDQELYLFEPQLGLPVPGPGQTGIATLRQAQEDESVLRRLNVPGWFDYPVTKPMVQDCIALVDAVPESLSWRMAALQEALTGEARMVVALDAMEHGKRLQKCAGVKLVSLWSVPVDAKDYQTMMLRARNDDALMNNQFLLQWGMLAGRTPLARARWLHLTGQFAEDVEAQESGALVAYQGSRLPDQEIDQLPVDVNLQIREGLRRRDGETPEQFAFKMQISQANYRKAKLAASYWLGLLLYDQRRAEAATSWLDKRFLESGGKGSDWADDARYNLARCYEQLGRTDEAIGLLKQPGGIQEHGDRIRARLLGRTEE